MTASRSPAGSMRGESASPRAARRRPGGRSRAAHASAGGCTCDCPRSPSPACFLPGRAPGPRCSSEAGCPSRPIRRRVASCLAAQLPLGIAGEREILDVVLSTRLPVGRRARTSCGRGSRRTSSSSISMTSGSVPHPRRPPSSPPTTASEVAGVAAGRASGSRPRRCLPPPRLPRERHREKKTQAFDLRPLILSLSVAAAAPPAGSGSDAPTAARSGSGSATARTPSGARRTSSPLSPDRPPPAGRGAQRARDRA